MNNFLVLLSGELQRMKKYNILAASFITSLIWIGVLHFTEVRDVSKMFPLLMFLDATSMSMLMVGVTMFFEKQEGVIKTFLVSPISRNQYILAKTFSNIVSNLQTLILLYLYARIFKEINISLLGLLVGVILIAFFHSMVGFMLTYSSKDFTELLMGMMKYLFILMLPVALAQFGLITNEIVTKALYALPTQASMILLQATAGTGEGWEILLSSIYLIAASGILYVVVLKRFDKFAIKESGV